MPRRVFFGLAGLPVVVAAVLTVTRADAQTPPTPPRDSLPTVPVTVTVTSVSRTNGGDIGSPPDYFSRIHIDGAWFESGRVDDSSSITPGWSFTRNVSRQGGFVPIRIEIKDYDGELFPPEDVDVDPAVCPPSLVIGDGCATITIGRPPVDFKGIDISFNPATGAVIPSDSTGDASSTSPSPCPSGTETAPLGLGSTATMCFTISVGPPNPIVVTKTEDFDPATDDGFCTRTDCSLREALWAAQNGDTIELRALGRPYQLTYEKRDLTDVQLDEPGHLKITRQLTIIGPKTGASVVVEQTLAGVRVFDVHGTGNVTMKNLTIRGGSAGDNSTALPSHKHGGGIHNHGTVNLVNVTLTGNHAPLNSSIGGGGAIWNAGAMTLKHVTIAGNDAEVIAGGLGGLTATLTYTLIANNVVPDGSAAGETPAPLNCSGSHVNGGGNTQFPGTTCGAGVAELAASPIGSNLGADFTFWLIPGSKAIDVTDLACEPDDQAGTPRPLDGNGDGRNWCDSGATEYDPHGLGVIHQPLNSATGQPGPVNMTFDDVTAAGTSTLTISTTGPARPSGYRVGTPALYYDLATAATFTGGVKVCIDYTGTTFVNVAGLRLFHHSGGNWHDKTVSLDTTANEICGRTTSFSVFAIFGANQAPVASIAEPAGGYRLSEGGSVVLRGSGSDADGDPLTYEWSPATELNDRTLAEPTFSPRDDGTRVYTLVVRDGDATSAPASTTVRVDNAPPSMVLTGPADGTLYRAGSPVQVTTTFTDAGVDDVHTCRVDWDDDTPPQNGNVTESNGSGGCAAMRTFTSAGVYTLRVTIDDGDGGTATASTMVVVYDPNAGRVVGSGHIVSPAGAYRPNPAAIGNVTFALLAQYGAGAVPTGSVAATLPTGAQFSSTSLQWLVVTGFKSQVQGTGRINGAGDYGFLLTAYDGQQAGGGGADRLRLKIWNRAGGAVVYDNVFDPTATDDIDRAKPQPVGVGTSITIFRH